MAKKKIDLSDIKSNDLEETSTFTELMSRKERLNKKNNFIESDDIDDMINEKRKNTKDLKEELEKAKEEYRKEINNPNENKKRKEDIEESLAKTQILELTRTMKFNFEETKKENNKKKNGVTFLNIVGILNLICIGYYIYLLTFSNYQDKKDNYLIAGAIIVLFVLFFGISVVSNKKIRRLFNIFNLIAILTFIAFNIYILI